MPRANYSSQKASMYAALTMLDVVEAVSFLPRLLHSAYRGKSVHEEKHAARSLYKSFHPGNKSGFVNTMNEYRKILTCEVFDCCSNNSTLMTPSIISSGGGVSCFGV
jgi:hypothetical protein